MSEYEYTVLRECTIIRCSTCFEYMPELSYCKGGYCICIYESLDRGLHKKLKEAAAKKKEQHLELQILKWCPECLGDLNIVDGMCDVNRITIGEKLLENQQRLRGISKLKKV